jgi:hypothetical protein
VYFTSHARLKGTEEGPRQKIFIYADARVKLFREDPENELALLSLSGDGQALTYQTFVCEFFVFCLFADTHVLTANSPEDTFRGSGTFSGNKKWFVRGWREGKAVLVDLGTGNAAPIAGYTVVDPHATDDGSVLVQDNDGRLYLWRAGSVARVPTQFVATGAHVDRSRMRVAYERNYVEYELRIVDLATGADIQAAVGGPAPSLRPTEAPPLAPPGGNSLMRPTFSNDGKQIVFLAIAQGLTLDAFVMQTDGSSRRRLTTGGAVDAAIAGYGKVAIVATPDRLLHYDLQSGDSTELVPSSTSAFMDHRPPRNIRSQSAGSPHSC